MTADLAEQVLNGVITEREANEIHASRIQQEREMDTTFSSMREASISLKALLGCHPSQRRFGFQ